LRQCQNAYWQFAQKDWTSIKIDLSYFYSPKISMGDFCMEVDYKQFADKFAQAVIARDYNQAHTMLADWLQPTVSATTLQEMIEKEICEVCEANEIEESVYPDDWRVDGNSSTLESLKDERSYISARNSGWLGEQKINFSTHGDIVKPIAEEFTCEQFRKWLCIQFMPNPDAQGELGIDAFLDFWMAVAEVNGEYRIGYFEIEDPD
jgi:hypothetical protein